MIDVARLPVVVRYGVALGGVFAVTGLIFILGPLHLANASMLHLVVVLVAAVAFGRGPAVFAAIAAFLASNFFFVEPRFTLVVANPQEWVTLLLLLLTAIVTGQVAAGERARAEEAEGHAREARLLYEVALLMSGPTLEPALGSVAERLRTELGVAAVRVVVNRPDGVLLASASAGDGEVLERMSASHASGSAEVLSRAGSRLVRVRAPRARMQAASALRLLRAPLRGPSGDIGEIILAADRSTRLGPVELRLLAAVSAQLWGGVERSRLRHEANAAEILRRADLAKSALLDAVSHDLRTPLASIMASAGSLRQDDVDWRDDERRGFAEAIEHEAERLDRIVGNLLDLSRLESGTLQPDLGWYEPSALIHEVAARLRAIVAPHVLKLDLPDELPPVHLDYTEVDQVLSNLIENAAKYSPGESEILVTASVEDGALRVTVSDRGPGISEEVAAAHVRGLLPGTGLAPRGQRAWARGRSRPRGGARRSHLGREPAPGRRRLHL